MLRFLGPLAALLLLLLVASGLRAQPLPGMCAPGTATADLAVNDVRARLFNTGDLFGSPGSFSQYVVPQNEGVAPIFAAGVWVGGTVGGELRVAASQYSGAEFWPGPLGDDGRPVNPKDCSAYDRIFSVSARDVAEFEFNRTVSEDLAAWPVGLGAPTVDASGEPVLPTSLDQTIDLFAGERPVVFGDRTFFWVMNDVGNEHDVTGVPPIGLEVRVVAFAFASDDLGLDQATIYGYELVNKGSLPLDDARFSLWVDPDLGGAGDDYVGSDPERGLGFAYNADDLDDIYGSDLPAIGVDFLQGAGSLTYFLNDSFPGTEDPETGAEFFHYMEGRWQDGTPLTEGGTGYLTGGMETGFAFPGDPEMEAYWSEVNADNEGSDTPPGDRRFVLSSPAFSLASGARRTFDFAVLYADGTDHLNSVTELKAVSTDIQARYDDGELFARGAVPPVYQGPTTVELEAGALFNQTVRFSSLDDERLVAIDVEAMGLPNFSSSTMPGNPATALLTFTPDAFQLGEHVVTLTATDDAMPQQVTTETITFVVTPQTTEPPEDVLTLEPVESGVRGSFGVSVAALDDVDGDGVADVFVGAAEENGQRTLGRAYVYSGATGVLLRTLASPNEDDGGFGVSVAGVPDLDGDGAGDLLVGAFIEGGDELVSGPGRAYVFSGATGMLLRTLESPSPVNGGSFGTAVASVEDADGDGVTDLLIGAAAELNGLDGSGQAHLFSGATGDPLRTLVSPTGADSGLFGFSVAGVDDIDGDGRGDLLVGAALDGADNTGAAYLFSGATGDLLRTLDPPMPNPRGNDYFGFPVAAVPDADGDGVADLFVGALFEDVGMELQAGRAHLFSGATGELLLSLESPSPEAGAFFGIAIAGVEDTDGNGLGDLLVGAWAEDAGAQSAGRAYLFSGVDGDLLRTLVSPNPEYGGLFGRAVSGLPDTDGDGRRDLLVGAPGESGGAENAGRAYLIQGTGAVAVEPGVVVEAEEVVLAGTPFAVSAMPVGLMPTTAELRYRPTGASAFEVVPLTLEGDAYVGEAPASAVTLRGMEYYVLLTDGERTVTFPTEVPELAPSRVRVDVARQGAEIAIPSDAAYRMVSVPAVLDDPDPAAVFADNFGTYGPTSWRLLRWSPEAERYAEFDTLDTAVVPGAAFWLAAYADPEVGTFDVENARSVDASEPTEIVLQPGWNQIAIPFAFPVAWTDVVGSALVQPPARWDGTEYLVAQSVLDPWAGYFVLNDAGKAVTLEVPPVEALGGRQRSAGEEEGYRLRLRAEVAGRDLRDTDNVLGFAAADGTRRDLAEPPPIGPHLRLSVVEDGVRLAHSFRPTGDGGDWELELAATRDLLAAGPLSVRVALDEIGERPAGFGLYLLDLDRTAPMPLAEGAVELELSLDRPARRLRFIAGTEAYAESARHGIPLEPLAFALAPAYPNPFAHTATVEYHIAERADVRLEVFDLLGRRVAVLADGVHDAGRYTARWDGSMGGASAASGIYVYRLRAGSFTASNKLVLLR